MPLSLQPYLPALWSLAAALILFIIQFGVADLARIRARHTPGAPIDADHDSFLFCADRAHANTIENLSAFSLASLVAILTATHAGFVNGCAIAFAVARGLHMAFYYLDRRALRSVAFAAGLLATCAMVGGVIYQLMSA